MIGYNQQQKMIGDAIALFPSTFGLKAFSGTFRISQRSSYVNDSNVVMLYTQIEKDGQWLDFAKGTIEELRAAVVITNRRDEIEARMQVFVSTIQQKINEHFAATYEHVNAPEIYITAGTRFFKVCKRDHPNEKSGSVYCFVERETGAIYKAAGWNMPAKHARGNIFDDGCGWGSAVGVNGAVYLR
jgi:hypothetical protein